MNLFKLLALGIAALPMQCGPSGSDAPAPPAATVAPDWVSIPSIGIDRPLVAGAQRQIDSGQIVNYTGGPGGICWPGEGCIVWLNGHRTSAGGPLGQLPNLQMGATISVNHNDVVTNYTVVDTAVFQRTNLRPNFFRGDLMIQTSWTNGRIMVFYAVVA